MLDTSRSVASVVLDHSETAPVFQRYRIDFCCQGRLSLRDACEARAVNLPTLVEDLERAIEERRGTGDEDPRAMSTPVLVAHIVERHHGYLRRVFPFVAGLAAKVARVHGDHQPSLRALDETVRALIDALEPHLEAEENELFPALMARAPDLEVARRELATMEGEHLAVAKLLERIRALTDNFTPAEWACGSYRALYGELEALESDTFRHVHLENHVLSPRFGVQ